MTASSARRRAAIAAGRTAARLSRLLRRGEGGVISGAACQFIDPNIVRTLAAGKKIAIVTGTNGKTTTSAFLATALCTAGAVAANDTGANLPNGIAGALLHAPNAPYAVMEVDELLLEWALEHLEPAVVVLLNLSRDQLDRVHEVRRTADRWRAALATAKTRVIANADDPLVSWAAEPTHPVWLGIGQPWMADASICSACGATIDFDAHWSCSNCERRRQAADWQIVDDRIVDSGGQEHRVDLALPGRTSVANAAAALAAAVELGIDPDAACASFATVVRVADRYRMYHLDQQQVRLLLAKNPAGWYEMLEFLRTDAVDPRASVVLALNARVQDGLDPSWIWDVPFEELAGRDIACTGERAADLSTRLRYANVAHHYAPSFAAALRELPAGPVEIVANYTAFQQARQVFRNA